MGRPAGGSVVLGANVPVTVIRSAASSPRTPAEGIAAAFETWDHAWGDAWDDDVWDQTWDFAEVVSGAFAPGCGAALATFPVRSLLIAGRARGNGTEGAGDWAAAKSGISVPQAAMKSMSRKRVTSSNSLRRGLSRWPLPNRVRIARSLVAAKLWSGKIDEILIPSDGARTAVMMHEFDGQNGAAIRGRLLAGGFQGPPRPDIY